MTKHKKIPDTDSIRELAQFWDTHDFTDFERQMERVEEPVFQRQPDGHVVSVPLNPKEARLLKRLAKTKHIKDSTLIRRWIREKIQTS